MFQLILTNFLIIMTYIFVNRLISFQLMLMPIARISFRIGILIIFSPIFFFIVLHKISFYVF